MQSFRPRLRTVVTAPPLERSVVCRVHSAYDVVCIHPSVSILKAHHIQNILFKNDCVIGFLPDPKYPATDTNAWMGRSESD